LEEKNTNKLYTSRLVFFCRREVGGKNIKKKISSIAVASSTAGALQIFAPYFLRLVVSIILPILPAL